MLDLLTQEEIDFLSALTPDQRDRYKGFIKRVPRPGLQSSVWVAEKRDFDAFRALLKEEENGAQEHTGAAE